MKFIKQLWQYKSVMLDLSITDWKKEYTETMFGMFWAVFKPFVTIFTFWFVFTYGLKIGGPVEGDPFILWFLAGVVPWFFMSESLSKGADSLVSYAILITTIKFPVMSLPIIQILSRFYTHLIIVGFMLLVFIINGYYPSIYWLNLIYFMFAAFVLMIAINMITSALGVILKDTGQIITAIMMPLYWLTPIMYQVTNLPEVAQILMKLLNPFFYIINGFRESLLENVWFWEAPLYDIYFWIFTLVLLFIGIRIQKYLRPIMADMI